MGYTTDFEGKFDLDKPLTEEHAAYINKFNNTRRVKRDSSIAENLDDTERKAVDLPIGDQGAFFVGGKGDYGQEHDKSFIDNNTPPDGQPGLWCQWKASEDLESIEWDGGEKFYSYEEWLKYIIANFLFPWGYIVNGSVKYQGEDPSDCGIIEVKDNRVSSREFE
jgi:hypothetical protein